MKHNFFIFMLALGWSMNSYAQSSYSVPMNFHIEKDVIPPILEIVQGSLQFDDPNQNGVIDAKETCTIRFQVANTGRGDGYGCVARVQMNGNTKGIKISDVTLPTIPVNGKTWVKIPIISDASTITGEVFFDIFVDEPNGYGSEHITSTIGTHKLKTPLVKVASYKVLGGGNGVLERRKSFTLQVAVQNVDQGVANNVEVDITLPKNVNWNGGDEQHLFYYNLQPGETKLIEYELMANQNADENIEIGINLKEQQGLFAQGSKIPLQFGQMVGGSIGMNINRKDQDVEIKQTSLVSAVDVNIPVSNNKNENTFVLIIANEDYKEVASVPYALNDGNVFMQYCIKTLGIPEEHIIYQPNATGVELRTKIGRLKQIAEVYQEDQPHIIFYYAGHGIPDESSKAAYLLPIDGVGFDVRSGYKIDNLFTTLGALPASSVTVFMDACFSGSTRDDHMLASARGVAIKTKSGVPQGNMVVFSAAQGDETAYPNEKEGHGMFTYFLLKKLQETEGNVTLQELGDYITKNVSKQSIVINGKSQTPSVNAAAAVSTSWQTWKLK